MLGEHLAEPTYDNGAIANHAGQFGGSLLTKKGGNSVYIVKSTLSKEVLDGNHGKPQEITVP